MHSRFKVGQTVKMAAYTDCFGEFHPEVKGLLVTKVTQIIPTCDTLKPYYRIVAAYPNTRGYHEGAERFFEEQ